MIRIPLCTALAALLLLAACCAAPAGAQDDERNDELTVLEGSRETGPANRTFSRYLRARVDAAFAAREENYERLETAEDCRAHQQKMKMVFFEAIGDLPEKTPLNPVTVGAIDRGDYVIERVIYESQPRHYVTANLYLPKNGTKPYPVVLLPCGHTANGKGGYQSQPIFLAKNGIATLVFDPIGQGERYQILDEDGRPKHRSTGEHTLVGAASTPVGRGAASYRIWDGIRSIDYLETRPEVDVAKLGVTGSSGGGLMTAYLGALDDRALVAAPSCYITSHPRLIATIGPQDHEQNIFGQIKNHLGHGDFLMIRAPKPTLILAATEDFFDIKGTWDTYREAKRFYTRLGHPERVGLVEVDAKHSYPTGQREPMVHWMRRWQSGIDEHVTEPELQSIPAQQLVCTEPGQVQLLPGARSVMDLNVELAEKYAPGRESLWKDRDAALAEVRRISGIKPLAELPQPKIEHAGSVRRTGYTIGKLVLESEPGVKLPVLLFQPQKSNGQRVLYLHGGGKQEDAAPGGAIEKLAQEGTLVLAADLRGLGETGPGSDSQHGGVWNDVFLSYLLGTSYTAMRAEDALVCARFLAGYGTEGRTTKVDLVAIGSAGTPALHAAALESDLFGNVKIVRSLASWMDYIREPETRGQFANSVYGALKAYDLPDLVASLPKDSITIEQPLAPASRGQQRRRPGNE
ncbi:MAG: acetylxylan esterase [Planctomycetaceae bacterium]